MSGEGFKKINQNAENTAAVIYKSIGSKMPTEHDLIKWAEKIFNFQITLRYTKLPCSGLVLYNPLTKGYQIRINRSEPICRRRFTICHEVAHIVVKKSLAYGFSTGDIFTKGGLERFCDRFAASFLMPSDLFILKWKSISDADLLKKARVANFFNVSVDAARYRAEELNLIN